jgi:DNA-binding response OmpR family regulator
MLKVLIVDDDPDIRLLLTRMVTKQGHIPTTATNGLQGQVLAFSCEADLILLDFHMPLQDGYVTCRNLRRAGYKGKIVIMSALHKVLGTPEALTCGADGYLPKPLTIENLDACYGLCQQSTDTAHKA